MNILFICHSLIEFFDWQGRFPDHKVANLGVAGETVEGLLARIDRTIKKHPSADLIFLVTGLNNIAMEDFKFFDSYKKIIEKLSCAYPNARIFVNSVLPTLILEFIPDKWIQDVNISLKKLARDVGVEFLDIYRHFIDGQGKAIKDLFLDDGVHLSERGYGVWTNTIEGIINQ